MIRTDCSRKMVYLLIKPLCIVLLLFGLFCLIGLRSNIVTVEYELSALEKKKTECLKEKRMLLAEKASLQSFERVEASLRKSYNLVFPDRVKMVYLKAQKRSLPRKALHRERLAEPR